MRTRPDFDFSRLRGRIIEKYGKLEIFAKAMKMSESSLSQKINSLYEWRGTEMLRACALLEIPLDELHLYFFTKRVSENETYA